MLSKRPKFVNSLIKRLAILGFSAFVLVALLFTGWYRIRFKVIVNPDGNRIIVQRQSQFSTNAEIRKTTTWLAQRWSTSEDNIYLITDDSEPWMKILGFLDIQTLSSAEIWIIDDTHEEGRGWIINLINWNTPHEGNIYLRSEYRPETEPKKEIAARFYSTPTYWPNNLFGGLAIILGISWTDIDQKDGEIIAYQSQDYLPSISIPIEKGVPQKWHAFQTPAWYFPAQ